MCFFFLYNVVTLRADGAAPSTYTTFSRMRRRVVQRMYRIFHHPPAYQYIDDDQYDNAYRWADLIPSTKQSYNELAVLGAYSRSHSHSPTQVYLS